MEIPYFVLHAFASRPFTGSPAVVCMLQERVDDSTLLAIAGESAATETTFLTPALGGYEIRWFSRDRELSLCTHATLAAGAVVLRHLSPGLERVTFTAESGPLEVTQSGELLFALTLPRLMPTRLADVPEGLARGLRIPPAEVLQAGKYVAVYPDERDVRAVTPDRALLEELGVAGVIVTARGESADVVVRSFSLEGPMLEETVSGSAFSRLVPYWSARLGKEMLTFHQLSKRGGTIYGAERAELGGRVEIAGAVVPFAHGRLYV